MRMLLKKFFVTILYFILINSILFIGHFWAFCGVAFNDTGAQYNNIIEALPIILFGIMPLVIGSIIFIFKFRKKENFIFTQFLILQVLVIIGWVLFYIVNYVPNSRINNYINSKIQYNNTNNQNRINEEALKELNNNYLLIDSISNQEQSVTIYFSNEKKKLIVEYGINGEKNYNIIDSIKRKSATKEKIGKYDSNFYFKFDQYDNLSICNNDECYYTYSNCKITGNTYDYSKYLSIYNSNGEKIAPIQIYKTLVKESVSNNENIYFIDNNRIINIELTDIGIKISDNDKQYVNNETYMWVILKDGKNVIQRSLTDYELVFEKDFKDKKYYADMGNYECYLKTYVNGIGYIKISNSVYWSNNGI